MQEVLKKLRLTNGGIVLHAPEAIEREFIGEGFSTGLNPGDNQNVVVFLADSKAVFAFLDKQLKSMKYDGLLWLLYPKGTSGIPTDINRDKLWKLAAPYGIRPVTNVSFSNEWSALRFRPIDAVGK